MTNFSTLSLSKEMLINLEKIGYKSMSLVQEQSLPHILEKKDVIVKAKTGSGKTAAFGIGLLQNLDVKKFRIQALVLCPTRELADQVAKELRNIAKFTHNIKILTLCGGSSFGMQLNSLRHNAHIIVGTPGRVLKHLNKNSLILDNLQTLVLDEADRMLDMGFIEEINEVIKFTPQKKQTLLFSATYPDDILQFSKEIQNNAISIETSFKEVPNKIIQKFYEVTLESKIDFLIKILSQYNPSNVIVFCNMKISCDELAYALQDRDIDALALHGDMEQYDRNDVLVQFSNGSCRVLIATDVASRGLDIKELPMIINYDLANTKEIYTHRIGRTGRAGLDGLAFSLFTKSEASFLDEYDTESILIDIFDDFKFDDKFEMKPEFITLVIEGGKKNKLRKGDILGALTSGASIQGNAIGKIDIYDRQSYVAIKSELVDLAHKSLKKTNIKGKKFTSWIL
jgi:ATP-independent RNA helicase DbpA